MLSRCGFSIEGQAQMTRILIVDDERDIRTTLAYNLRHAGYRVLEAGNAFDAVEAVHNDSVDLVVLDWVLPDMSGIDLCRKLKGDSRTKHLPVVMLTARVDEIDRVVALEVGADDYITKPFSVREAVLRIQRLVEPRGAEGDCGDPGGVPERRSRRSARLG